MGPMAATQVPETRSEVEPGVVVATVAVLGTVMSWLEPLLGWTVTVPAFTAVTTPRTLPKSDVYPPEGRGAKLKLGRPPGKPPASPPGGVAGQAPLTSGETVNRLAVIAPEASLPVAVMQLPTVMSETLPVPVSLIGCRASEVDGHVTVRGAEHEGRPAEADHAPVGEVAVPDSAVPARRRAGHRAAGRDQKSQAAEGGDRGDA